MNRRKVLIEAWQWWWWVKAAACNLEVFLEFGSRLDLVVQNASKTKSILLIYNAYIAEHAQQPLVILLHCHRHFNSNNDNNSFYRFILNAFTLLLQNKLVCFWFFCCIMLFHSVENLIFRISSSAQTIRFKAISEKYRKVKQPDMSTLFFYFSRNQSKPIWRWRWSTQASNF